MHEINRGLPFPEDEPVETDEILNDQIEFTGADELISRRKHLGKREMLKKFIFALLLFNNISRNVKSL